MVNEGLKWMRVGRAVKLFVCRKEQMWAVGQVSVLPETLYYVYPPVFLLFPILTRIPLPTTILLLTSTFSIESGRLCFSGARFCDAASHCEWNSTATQIRDN